jgi:group I intron endonuclease
MYYTIYKITNQIDGKIYIGSHKTKDLDDNYMGSGKYLRRAQEKYGIENFKKEILFVFETAEEMYDKEAEIVNEDFLATENTYNLKIGGFGGWDHLNDCSFNHIERCKKANASRKTIRGWVLSKEQVAEFSRLGVNAMKEKYPNGPFAGKKHTEETKIKMRNAAIGRGGSKNSQYGTRWIHSLELKISKKIRKEEPLPVNWFEGRKINFS